MARTTLARMPSISRVPWSESDFTRSVLATRRSRMASPTQANGPRTSGKPKAALSTAVFAFGSSTRVRPLRASVISTRIV